MNKQRMGRLRDGQRAKGALDAQTPNESPRKLESLQQRKNIALEVSPPSDRSSNLQVRGSAPSSQMSRSPDLVVADNQANVVRIVDSDDKLGEPVISGGYTQIPTSGDHIGSSDYAEDFDAFRGDVKRASLN
ncbi:MAG: hypothetical protein ACPIOQ_14955 [Promethearchaeia archaeon]